MVNYVQTFTQFGAELRNLRKIEALYEHSHFATDANFSKRLVEAAYDETIDEEEIAETTAKNFLEATLTPQTRAIHEAQRGAFELSFFPVLDAELIISQRDRDAGAIQYAYDTVLAAAGQIKISERLGRLGALRRQMIADAQTILKNTVTLGALAAAAGNQGVIVATTKTGSDHSFAGNVILEVSDSTVGATTFNVSLELTKELVDGTRVIVADNLLTLGQSFEDGPTGLTLLLDLGPLVEAGDNGNIFSASSITSPNEADTDRGKIYIKVTRNAAAPIWTVEVFSNGALTDLVGSQQFDGVVGTQAISILGAGGMTFASTFDKAAANVHLPVATNIDSDISFDIVNPREGDRWTIPVTNDEAGNFATKIGRRYRASLNSSGAPTISDALAASISMV